MGEIATSNREIILFYDPNCTIAEKTLAYANSYGLPIREVDILKTPFTGTQLEELAARLKTSIDNLANQEHPEFERFFGKPNLSDEDWIKILRKNPRLINGPIAIKGNKTLIIKNPSDVIKL